MADNRFLPIAVLILIFCIVPVLAAGAIRQGAIGDLDYTLQVVREGEHLRIHVVMGFVGDASGRGKLRLPKEEGDGDSLSTPVQALQPLSSDTRLSDTPDPYVKAVTYPPKSRILVAYDLVQSWAGTVVAHNVYRQKAILQRDYFHSFGNAFWVVPDWPTSTRQHVMLHWKDLPAGWKIANSFGTGRVWQTFRASLDEIMDGIYVGGDFRVGKVSIRGKPIYIALRGQGWKFKDAELYDAVGGIVTVERNFWRDYHLAYMLVTLIPTEDEIGTFSGQGRTNAFALFLPQTTPLNYFLKHTLAHETFHVWLPGQMNSLDPPIWFFEGFTDYYACQLLLRSGLATVQDVAGFYNMRLKEYYRSPVRNVPWTQARADMFKSNANFQLPYQRGLLIASKWDQDLRNATKGHRNLDNVMQQLPKIARKKTPGSFRDVIVGLLKPDLNGTAEVDMLRYIQNGETLAPAPEILGPTARLQNQVFSTAGSEPLLVPQFRVEGK